MNNIKELHPKEGVVLLAVKVPDGAYDFVYYESDCHTEFNVIEWKEPLQKIGSFVKSEGGYIIDDDFDYMILGTPDQITEEVWQGIMLCDLIGGIGGVGGQWLYPDYQRSNCDGFEKATESAMSFLEANEVYSVNPKLHPADIETMSIEHYIRLEDNWNKAEANTGTWVLLLKL